MSDGSRDCVEIQQFVVPFALKQAIRASKERLTLSPLSEQRCKDVCADCQKQDGSLSFENTITDGNACVTETTYSEGRRPNNDAGNQERPGRGKDWRGAGSKPQQNWERPADRQ